MICIGRKPSALPIWRPLLPYILWLNADVVDSKTINKAVMVLQILKLFSGIILGNCILHSKTYFAQLAFGMSLMNAVYAIHTYSNSWCPLNQSRQKGSQTLLICSEGHRWQFFLIHLLTYWHLMSWEVFCIESRFSLLTRAIRRVIYVQ